MSDRDERTRASYDSRSAEIANCFWEFELTETWDTFTGSLPAGGRVADIGCGPGRDTAQFIRRGYWAAGLDFSSGMLGEARQRAPAPYLQGDMRILPFASESFEGAWTCASLLHLPREDAPGVLVEIHRVLKPGGVLYLSLKGGDGEYWDYRKGERFFTLYQEDEIRTYLAEAGFQITEMVINPGEREPWLNIFARKIER